MIKRSIGIVIGLIALTLFSPIILFVIILIRLKFGSPVFFRKTRPGKKGTPFTTIKFRSMRDISGSEGQPATDGERLAGFGKLLRSTSLDELPKHWNVLKGDMNLVGPRPLLMEYLLLYSVEQARRHVARPGITGRVQVKGSKALSWDEKWSYCQK